MARPGVRVLNDDHTILRKIDWQLPADGTPWPGHGGIALAEDAPLERLTIRKHASSTRECTSPRHGLPPPC